MMVKGLLVCLKSLTGLIPGGTVSAPKEFVRLLNVKLEKAP